MAVSGRGQPIVINEIHYHPDVKTEPAKFVELYNMGATNVDLSGWYFSDGIGFTFPAGTLLAPQGCLVVAQNPAFLRQKYGAVSLGPFGGDLSAKGEKLVLRNAEGTKIAEVDYRLGFPWPTVGEPPGSSIELIHPGLDPNLGGSWRSSLPTGPTRGPTPGRQNSVYAVQAPPQIHQVQVVPPCPVSGQEVLITAKVTDPDGVGAVTLFYQLVEPGAYLELNDPAYSTNWTPVPMNDGGADGDLVAGDNIYTARLPGTLQVHRRLVRYRLRATDRAGSSVTVPYPDDPQPNFAYFVYDGVPAWTGADRPGVTPPVTYDTGVMRRLPVYHLISKRASVEAALWRERYQGSLYKWSGTLVYDGKVYDHIHYRARGGVWRYSMVKNMWKFDFNRGHDFAAKDNWGQDYATTWTKLNLGACIQQGDYGHRGEQGMFESVGFRLFNLAGVKACHTHWVQLRVIDDLAEANPANQFEGDYWGLYLAVEQMDGRFLDEHDLPDGNFYKMEYGTGELNNQGATAVTDQSDLRLFLSTYSGNPSDAWWRTNFDLASYYGYQGIIQAIHHYDVGAGKNYFYYLNPQTQVWSVHPWDLDLTWADNMYDAGGQGAEPFKTRVLPRAAFNLEYRNRLREIRDLLFNLDQAWTLIDEYAAVIHDPAGGPSPTDADRAQWDYNPKMSASGYSDAPSKAGQGRFYQFPNEPKVPKQFSGAVQLMKNYVTNRMRLLDTLASDSLIPTTPLVVSQAPTNFPINRLTFASSSFAGSGASFAGLHWRVGEITPTNQPPFVFGQPRHYEIDAVWESGTLTNFLPSVTIPGSALKVGHGYRVRARWSDTTGRWSHWSAPVEFVTADSDQTADLLACLRLSELMPTPAGGSEYEFLEMRNLSSQLSLDLSGVTFTKGIDFSFPVGTILAPSAYLLVVKAATTNNFAGFRAHYGLGPNTAIVGPFSGSLANEGERITLKTAAGGQILVDFTYGSGAGWPAAAQGLGYSLVPVDSAQSAPQHQGTLSLLENWRASAEPGGSPGRADPLPPVTNSVRIGLERPTNGIFRLLVSGSAGDRYVLQGSTNLINWLPLATNAAPTGTASFSDTQTTVFPQRFYRALKLP